MKPAQLSDLQDLSDIMESFTKKLEKLNQADQIDLAARLKPVAKMIDEIDTYVKAALKPKIEGKEADGDITVLGGEFKAIIKPVPVDMFQQKAFKADKPALAAQYTETVTQIRVSFELR